MTIYRLGDRVPTIHPDAYVHPDAVVIGDVTIGPESTVWACTVLRGDFGTITIGARQPSKIDGYDTLPVTLTHGDTPENATGTVVKRWVDPDA